MPNSALSDTAGRKLAMARSSAFDITIFFAGVREVAVTGRDHSTIRQAEFTVEFEGLNPDKSAGHSECSFVGEQNLLSFLEDIACVVVACGREVRIHDRAKGMLPLQKLQQIPGFVITNM